MATREFEDGQRAALNKVQGLIQRRLREVPQASYASRELWLLAKEIELCEREMGLVAFAPGALEANEAAR